MRYFMLLIVLVSFGLIVYGFSLDETQEATAHKYIGSGTAGLFLIAMPLFLYTESKGKDFKDYLLNEENIRKMKANEKKKNRKP